MISLRSEELGPLIGAFFLDKKLWKICVFPAKQKERSKFFGEGGSFISTERFGRQEWSRGVIEGIN